MKKLLLTWVFFFLTFNSLLFGYKSANFQLSYKVSGSVIDNQTEKPMSYATVALLSRADSSIENGNITNEEGKFEIGARKPGDYIIKVKFIGYESFYRDVQLGPENPEVELGIITLESSSMNIDEVTIEATDRAIEYKIDRKVVNVEKQYSSLSGTAIDVLKNVPSIDVDIEDNVSIRGNSNFTVLIDGRPSVLEGSEALQQFPAGMIKDIEIITNPSAKFDPEGTGGIINIITRKRTITGLSGLVQGDIGFDEKYGGDFLLNYRTEKFNYYIGGDYNERNYPGTVKRRQETYRNDTISYLNSDGSYTRMYDRYSIRGGIEWFPNDKNTISLSGRYGSRSRRGVSTVRYEEWTNYSPTENSYINSEDGERSGNFYSLNSEYTHYFNGKISEEAEHRLDVNVMLYKRQGDEESVNFLMLNGSRSDGQKSTETGPAEGIEYRLNYEKPFTTRFNLEAGLQGSIDESNESNALYFYNPSDNMFEFQDQFSHNVSYSRNIQALYSLFRGTLGNFGYQLGLRTEYTYRNINMEDHGQFNIDRWDYFPTLHTSYQLGEKDQFMASYSKRIDRPRGWYLEPFITWSDAYNVRRGEPDLQPEYIDSYEFGYQRDLSDKDYLSAEVYYRVTDNKIERIREVYRDNIMLSTYANIGTDYALGSEVMLNMEWTDWWESNISGNFYNYKVKGEVNGEELNRGRFTWSVEWNSIFRLSETTIIQLNPEYDSPEVEAQETESAEFEVDGAIRQSLLNNRLNLTLQVRDIFNTDKHESVTEAEDFYSYRLYTHRAPIIMLNISFRINNYRDNSNWREGRGGEGEGEEGEL